MPSKIQIFKFKSQVLEFLFQKPPKPHIFCEEPLQASLIADFFSLQRLKTFFFIVKLRSKNLFSLSRLHNILICIIIGLLFKYPILFFIHLLFESNFEGTQALCLIISSFSIFVVTFVKFNINKSNFNYKE